MSVKLTIEIAGPLGPDDKDILTGTTMILLSLAQRYVTEEEEEEKPQPCGDIEYHEVAVQPAYARGDDNAVKHEATGRVCISPVGHKGRHRFRDPVGGLN